MHCTHCNIAVLVGNVKVSLNSKYVCYVVSELKVFPI